MSKRTEEKQPRKVYSIAEFGAQVGLSKNAAYNAVHRGDVPSIKIGGRIFIPKTALDKMLCA